jgi:hypothetical protein
VSLCKFYTFLRISQHIQPTKQWMNSEFSRQTRATKHMPKSQLNMLKSAWLSRDIDSEMTRATKHTLRLSMCTFGVFSIKNVKVFRWSCFFNSYSKQLWTHSVCVILLRMAILPKSTAGTIPTWTGYGHTFLSMSSTHTLPVKSLLLVSSWWWSHQLDIHHLIFKITLVLAHILQSLLSPQIK